MIGASEARWSFFASALGPFQCPLIAAKGIALRNMRTSIFAWKPSPTQSDQPVYIGSASIATVKCSIMARAHPWELDAGRAAAMARVICTNEPAASIAEVDRRNAGENRLRR